MNSTTSGVPPYRIAYIGLGAMGAPMAANLLARGHTLYVWNRTPGKAQPLQDAGAQVLPSLEALRDVDVEFVFTNVSDSAALRSVVTGPGGLAQTLRPGTTVIDNSSVHPPTAREMAELLAARGIAFLDAPVTGGTGGAKAGTLTIMVGGEPEVMRRCEPLLRVVGSSIFYIGPVGSGQACKLCNQVIAACAMLGLCEGLAMAAKANLPVKTVFEVLASGSAGSVIVKTQGAKIVANDMSPGFRVDLMRKDLGLSLIHI